MFFHLNPSKTRLKKGEHAQVPMGKNKKRNSAAVSNTAASPAGGSVAEQEESKGSLDISTDPN